MANSVLKNNNGQLQGQGGNPLNSILGGGGMPSQDVMKQFMDFRKNFQGDPKKAVMDMMSKGQINNAQLQQVMQMAKQFQGMLK